MKTSNFVFILVVACLIFYIGNRFGELYENSLGETYIDKLTSVSENYDVIFEDIRISFEKTPILWGMVATSVFAMIVLYKAFDKKNYRQGEEHGSAKWGQFADIKKYIDKDYKNNMIFTQTERMSLNTRKTRRNNNTLVIGGSGSGKTRFFVKPNLLQLHTSYVVTDPKGTILEEIGHLFAENGYKIKTFNTIDFEKSMHYNPFGFIKSESDILIFVDLLITSTKEKGEKSADQFWENAEKLLYRALIGYIFYEYPEELHNFSSLLDLLNKIDVREDDETYMNEVDYMFEEIELGTIAFSKKYNIDLNSLGSEVNIKEPKPNHFALLQYKKFKMSAGKTTKSILISCGVRLSPFEVAKVREITSYDEMELSTLGDEKTILFIIIDDIVKTYNFLVAMMYSQMFKELCDRASKNGGRLPIHVRCILDEFANIGQIPNFEQLISVIRSREISVNVIVQNMAQIEALYDKQAGTIVGNCDTTLFLGSGEEKTMKSISDRVGKQTIDHRGTSTTKGHQGSFSLQDQIIGRELITADEVGRLNDDECILFVRGLKPFKSKKFKLESHYNFKKTGDYKKDFMFNITEYNTLKNEIKDDFKEYYLDDDDIEILRAKAPNLNI